MKKQAGGSLQQPSSVVAVPIGWVERSLVYQAALCAAALGVMGVDLGQIIASGKPGKTGGARRIRQGHVRAVLKPQSSVYIFAERGEVKVVESCARARSAQVRPKGRARLPF